MLSICLGELGMTEAEFWDTDLRQIENRIAGFRRLEAARERAAWERTRWLGAIILTPHAKKGRKIKPSDLFQFPDEAAAQPNTFDPLGAHKDLFRDLIESQGVKVPEVLQEN